MTYHNLDPDEIQHFDQLANAWWDPEGPLKTLHDINPLRLAYLQSKTTLANKKILDIGCGGGILAEALAKGGAFVTAIDLSEPALTAAKLHQQMSGSQIEYQQLSAEAMADAHPNTFDIITCLELLEHVPCPEKTLSACARLLKPNGHAFFSTLNRTFKSYVCAIIGAEYVLKMLPMHTHDFAKFIRPSELAEWARQAGFSLIDITGMTYHPWQKKYSLGTDVSVNYLVQAVKL